MNESIPRGGKILGGSMIVVAIMFFFNSGLPLILQFPVVAALAGAGIACAFVRPTLQVMLPVSLVFGAVGYVVALSMAQGIS